MTGTFEEFYAKMKAQITNSTIAILNVCEENNVNVKKSGYMADNIWLMDFNKKSYLTIKPFITKQNLPDNVERIVYYDKTNRIVFHF